MPLARFIPYNFQSRKVFEMKREVIPASKHVRSESKAANLARLPSILAVYRTGVLWATLESVRRNQHVYDVFSRNVVEQDSAWRQTGTLSM